MANKKYSSDSLRAIQAIPDDGNNSETSTQTVFIRELLFSMENSNLQQEQGL